MGAHFKSEKLFSQLKQGDRLKNGIPSAAPVYIPINIIYSHFRAET
jgi:hypothetical protein